MKETGKIIQWNQAAKVKMLDQEAEKGNIGKMMVKSMMIKLWFPQERRMKGPSSRANLIKRQQKVFPHKTLRKKN